MSLTPPDRQLERQLASQVGIIVGMDEVGRGSIAGPVCVGAVAVTEQMPPQPEGLTDSKLLTARRREQLLPAVKEWAISYSVGWASSTEIDSLGIVGALRLAGWRALTCVNQDLHARGLTRVNGVLLDGTHDWLTSEEPSLFASNRPFDSAQIDDKLLANSGEPQPYTVPVRTQVKADLFCVAVAAASIVAKVTRDEYMSEVDDPGYEWASNKGYASKQHIRGLEALGVSDLHRQTWKLPGISTKNI